MSFFVILNVAEKLNVPLTGRLIHHPSMLKDCSGGISIP